MKGLDYLIVIALLTLLREHKTDGATVLKIGGLFRNTSTGSARKAAFLLAIDVINNDSSILPNYLLQPVINVTESLNPYEHVQAACIIASEGIVAMVGPGTSTDTKAANTVLSSLNIPEISPSATDPNLDYNSGQYPFLLRMSQPDSIQSEALVELIERFHWKRIAILNSKSDYGANGLAKFKAIAAEKEWLVVAVEEFDINENPDLIDARDQLRRIRDNGVRVVVLNCIALFARKVLEQANSLAMTEKSWAWVVTDGITGDGMYNTNAIPSYAIGLIGTSPTSGVGSLADQFQTKWSEQGLPGTCNGYNARAVDAVLVLANALHEMLEVDGKSLNPVSIDCALCGQGTKGTWSDGANLLQYMKKIQTNGIMNYLNFTESGSPWFSAYDIVNLQAGGLKEATGLKATSNDSSIVWMGGETDTPIDSQYDLDNVTFRIVTMTEEPFVMLKPGMNTSNPDAYEGFCIDLLKEMQKTLQFNYNIHLSKDGKFGGIDTVTEKWNGMVGELERGEADLALASMTITFARQQVIQFTKPYLDLGLSIAMKIPDSTVNIFGFKEPFSLDLWMCVVFSFVVVGFCTLLLDKLSPTGMYGAWAQDPRQDDDENDEELKAEKPSEYMDLKASMFFSFGALLQQGSDLIPKSFSGRVLGTFWWATIMIIISTYTANLAAFLTKNRMEVQIKSVEDLAEQTKVKYGTVRDTAVSSFFFESIVPTYNSMAQFMDTHGTLLQDTNTAFKKVREEDFAFIWDSPVLEYLKFRKPCDLMIVGRIFGKSGYGLGLPSDSLYADRFSVEILRLRELGFIEELWNKWYTERSECETDEEDGGSSVLTGRLDVIDMLGVFIVLYVGMVLGVISVFVEWFLASWLEASKKHPHRPNTWREAFKTRFQKIKVDLKETWFARCQKQKKVDDSVQNIRSDSVDGIDMAPIITEKKSRSPSISELENEAFEDDASSSPFAVNS